MPDKKKILLIDDDEALLHMYSLKFKIHGTYDLITADNPESGLSKAKKERPSLILLDLVLPKGSKSFGYLNKEIGFHVLEQLKQGEATKDIPVIILTNLDEKTQGNVEHAWTLGALDYCVKANLKPADVIDRVQAIVER